MSFMSFHLQYLTLYSVNMTYNLKKSIIQWESVCICICLRPRHGSLSVQCVVLFSDFTSKINCLYEGRSFNSRTNASSYHIAVRNSW